MKPFLPLLIVVFVFFQAPLAYADQSPGPAAGIQQGEPPTINPPFIVGIRPSTPFLWTVPVTGQRPLTFAVSHLPRGLSIDRSTGIITGIIQKPGDYTVNIKASNSFGQATQSVQIIVSDVIALTPPMGWNSYDAYGDTVDEDQILANARYIHDNMLPYGWDTVVVDFRWYDPNALTERDAGAPNEILSIDQYGRLIPALNRFPSSADGNGFKALADKIHAMGMKFGIHIMRGIPRMAVNENLPINDSPYHAQDAANTSDACYWCPDMYGVNGVTPAGQAYYDSLFKLYASWGVDYVKMDDTSAPYHADEINAVHAAIEKCGRSIIYSLSPGETPIEQADHVTAHANLWRISGDFWDNWQSLDNSFDLDYRWESWRGPGHWPDSDMLPVGHISINGIPVGPDRQTNFTQTEQVTMLSLWCLMPAPLMVGANLPDNNPFTLSLLTNREVLALDQDSTSSGANRVSKQNDCEVWSRKLANNSLAVGLFNRSEFAETITASWADLGIAGTWSVRDLWQHKDLGRNDKSVSQTIPPHGSALLLLTPIR